MDTALYYNYMIHFVNLSDNVMAQFPGTITKKRAPKIDFGIIPTSIINNNLVFNNNNNTGIINKNWY